MGTNTITTTQVAALMVKGKDKFYSEDWPRLKKQYEAISKTIQSDNKTWIYDELVFFGTAPSKTEGSASTKEDIEAPFAAVTVTNVAYAKHAIVSFEAREDDQYDKIGKIPSKMGLAAIDARDTVVADLYNNGFSSTTVPDGLSLFNSAHTLASGTQANSLSNPATLESQSIKDLTILAAKLTDYKGLKLNQELIQINVPVDLAYDAEQLIKSTLSPEDDTNAINPSMQRGLKINVNKYLTDTDGFFMNAEIQRIIFALRNEVSSEVHPQIDSSRNILYDIYQRFSAAATSYLDVVGTQGVA